MLESGIFIEGNGKSMVKFTNTKGEYLVAAAQNKGRLKIFKLKNSELFEVQNKFVAVELIFPDGSKQKQELSGSSFLSQSAKFFTVGKDATKAVYIDQEGKRLPVNLYSH